MTGFYQLMFWRVDWWQSRHPTSQNKLCTRTLCE